MSILSNLSVLVCGSAVRTFCKTTSFGTIDTPTNTNMVNFEVFQMRARVFSRYSLFSLICRKEVFNNNLMRDYIVFIAVLLYFLFARGIGFVVHGGCGDECIFSQDSV